MVTPLSVRRPLETAYVRRVLFALQVLDGVTLAGVSQGLKVTAAGLAGKPIVNSSGLFVWLQEGNRTPQGVEIEPGELPFLKATLTAAELHVPAPPPPDQRPRLIPVELAPRRDYPFGAGVTGVRGTLVRLGTENPPVPVAGAAVWLRWIDDNANGTTWADAPTRSATDSNGDFAAALRLSPAQVPRLDASGRVRLRLCVDRAALGTKASPEFQQSPGRVADARSPFVWDQFSQP
ncbi:MAG TPA: hypothetical protein VNE59_12435 [Burkholderiales bacterium]|nr:hypothetical protein [Burkholderiales bacterium]